jgi:hypothetical protein
VLGRSGHVVGTKDTGYEGVEHETALLPTADQPGVSQDIQVMGNVDRRGVQHVGNFPDIARAVSQETDDPQSLRGRQGAQELGTALGL